MSFEEKRAAFLKKKQEEEQQFMEEFRAWASMDFEGAEEESNGCFVKYLEHGNGAMVKKGDQLTVHYTGFFPDNRVFDSSKKRNKPFSFRIGGGRVIRSWDENLIGKKVGDKLILIAPYTLAYGEAGSPPVIPPKATLLFEVEVLGVE